MPMSIDERLDMLQKASRAWLELTRLLDRIPEAAMNQPGTVGDWSGRDLLVHIASWEEYALDVIEERETGGTAEWPNVEGAELDALNAELLESHRDSTVAEVRHYLESTHFALMDLAERARTIRSDMILEVTSDHYAQHMADLQAVEKAGRQS